MAFAGINVKSKKRENHKMEKRIAKKILNFQNKLCCCMDQIKKVEKIIIKIEKGERK